MNRQSDGRFEAKSHFYRVARTVKTFRKKKMFRNFVLALILAAAYLQSGNCHRHLYCSSSLPIHQHWQMFPRTGESENYFETFVEFEAEEKSTICLKTEFGENILLSLQLFSHDIEFAISDQGPML
jgi:hypothetical protein